MQSMAGSLIRSGESSQRISSSSPKKLDKRLTIICFMHNWDLPFLCIRLRFLLVSCRNRCDNDLAVGSRWKDQRCWTTETSIFHSTLFQPVQILTQSLLHLRCQIAMRHPSSQHRADSQTTHSTPRQSSASPLYFSSF
jgi:hypothetical protein